MLACLFWRRTTAVGLVAGMATGAATAVLWHELDGGVFALYEIVPAFFAASAAIAIASLASTRGSAGASGAPVFDRLRNASTGRN